MDSVRILSCIVYIVASKCINMESNRCCYDQIILLGKSESNITAHKTNKQGRAANISDKEHYLLPIIIVLQAS
jgi:hypothetical protein